MSKIEEMLVELCPNGVEYKNLGGTLKIKNGKDYKSFASGEVPVYGSGGIIAYIDTPVFNKASVLIPRKGSIDKLYYVDTPFWTVDTIFYTEIKTDVVIPKYIFYFLQKEHLENKTYSGGTPRANTDAYYKDGTIPWLRTQEVKFVDIYDTEIKITEQAIQNSAAKWIPSNCVIIAISGATAGRSGINKIPLTTNQHCYCLEIDETRALYKYVFYWVSFNYENIKGLGQGARGDLNSSIIKSYPIPIPPIEEQQRIVDILDKFDTLVNDLTISLPVEIKAREQQYEYYRDKLLNF